uniref:Uncharacterized protein n=1 Tax=Aegilops tauschii subsp. strangulata TaxID=200361 RepID=A0A452Z340_AEGTS
MCHAWRFSGHRFALSYTFYPTNATFELPREYLICY